jgi:hypothetical protein
MVSSGLHSIVLLRSSTLRFVSSDGVNLFLRHPFGPRYAPHLEMDSNPRLQVVIGRCVFSHSVISTCDSGCTTVPVVIVSHSVDTHDSGCTTVPVVFFHSTQQSAHVLRHHCPRGIERDKGMIAVDAKRLTRVATRVERVVINPDSVSSQMNWAIMYRTMITFGSRQVNLAPVRSMHMVQHRATGISCTGR